MIYGQVGACPNCGNLLWFVQIGATPRFFDEDSAVRKREQMLDFVANQLGVEREKVARNPDLANQIGADSWEIVKLVNDEEFPGGLPVARLGHYVY